MINEVCTWDGQCEEFLFLVLRYYVLLYLSLKLLIVEELRPKITNQNLFLRACIPLTADHAKKLNTINKKYQK